jgi:hypothetical protein
MVRPLSATSTVGVGDGLVCCGGRHYDQVHTDTPKAASSTARLPSAETAHSTPAAALYPEMSAFKAFGLSPENSTKNG